MNFTNKEEKILCDYYVCQGIPKDSIKGSIYDEMIKIRIIIMVK